MSLKKEKKIKDILIGLFPEVWRHDTGIGRERSERGKPGEVGDGAVGGAGRGRRPGADNREGTWVRLRPARGFGGREAVRGGRCLAGRTQPQAGNGAAFAIRVAATGLFGAAGDGWAAEGLPVTVAPV